MSDNFEKVIKGSELDIIDMKSFSGITLTSATLLTKLEEGKTVTLKVHYLPPASGEDDEKPVVKVEDVAKFTKEGETIQCDFMCLDESDPKLSVDDGAEVKVVGKYINMDDGNFEEEEDEDGEDDDDEGEFKDDGDDDDE